MIKNPLIREIVAITHKAILISKTLRKSMNRYKNFRHKINKWKKKLKSWKVL